MTRVLQILNKPVLVLLLVVMSTSCIKDNLNDCYVYPLTLNFHYTKNIQGEDLFTSKIDVVHLFVYENGELIADYEVEQKDLIDGYKYQIPIKPGDYNIVAWGGVRKSYDYLAINSEDDALMKIKSDLNGRVEELPEHNYHAKELHIKHSNLENQEYPMYFMKNTNDVRVIVKGIPQLTKNSENSLINCDIKAVNGVYKFDNKIYGNNRIHYIPEQWYEGADSYSDFVVMRLWRGDDSHLVVSLNEEDDVFSIYNASLSALLLLKPDTDLDLEDEFEIIFNLTGEVDDEGELEVEITINDWTVVDQNEGM